MDAFVWDTRFETGLTTVDRQHHHLVELVNKVGDYLLASSGDEAALESVFAELAAYATEHFAEEERLMAAASIDSRHTLAHTQHHQDFVLQLGSMWRRRGQVSDPAAMLHGFLASWLTMHILGEDQIMARMIADIARGSKPAEAFEREAGHAENSVSALLDALHKLYHVLSAQNRDLAEANQSLEDKVNERTRALAEANATLQKEQDDLRQALAHVEATQQQLLISEKMASLGQMVAGFAHQLNTPVGIAIGAVSNSDQVITATERLLDADEVSAEALLANFAELREGSRLALNNLQRAADLVRRLKRSSIDLDVMERRVFKLSDLIDDVLLGQKERLEPAWVNVSVDCPDELVLDGVPGLFEQLLTTLLGNAVRHAFPVQGRDARLKLSAAIGPDRLLHLICEDNGVGIPGEDLAHIFEPFFTTRRADGCLGLGLYLCYNLVTSRLGGTIDCVSAVGQGTTIRVHVPAVTGEMKS